LHTGGCHNLLTSLLTSVQRLTERSSDFLHTAQYTVKRKDQQCDSLHAAALPTANWLHTWLIAACKSYNKSNGLDSG